MFTEKERRRSCIWVFHFYCVDGLRAHECARTANVSQAPFRFGPNQIRPRARPANAPGLLRRPRRTRKRHFCTQTSASKYSVVHRVLREQNIDSLRESLRSTSGVDCIGLRRSSTPQCTNRPKPRGRRRDLAGLSELLWKSMASERLAESCL